MEIADDSERVHLDGGGDGLPWRKQGRCWWSDACRRLSGSLEV